MELETYLVIAKELAYLADDETHALEARTANVGKMLNRLIQALRKPATA